MAARAPPPPQTNRRPMPQEMTEEMAEEMAEEMTDLLETHTGRENARGSATCVVATCVVKSRTDRRSVALRGFLLKVCVGCVIGG